MNEFRYADTSVVEKCSICGKNPPNPPHALDMHSVFTLTLFLCNGCHTTMKRTTIDLINGLRKIRGVDASLIWPETEWK